MARYLVPHLYTADPHAHVFEGKLYIYPSHDIDAGIPENDNGDHFDMRDYHVFSMEEVDGAVTDHGVALDVKDIPWAGRQLWDCDCACKDGKYYLYFPVKDRADIFRIGVAISDKPEGPFVAQEVPIKDSYSIDPCVFCDEDGSYYMYFGGLWGGQLQFYRNNKAVALDEEPADGESALSARVVKMSEDMLQFDEKPRAILLLDADGNRVESISEVRAYAHPITTRRWKNENHKSYCSIGFVCRQRVCR